MEYEVVKSFTGTVSGCVGEVKDFEDKIASDLLAAGYIEKLKTAKGKKDAAK